jgi:glycerophosphoryl diester phosphodiesterase
MPAAAPITFAHRCGRADAPENSIEACRRALAVGASGLESDARLSGDGQAVLSHGAAFRRGLRRTPLRSLTVAQLAEVGVPSLAALYAEVGTDYELSLDLKEPEVAGPVLEAAGAAGAIGRLWLCSDDVDVLKKVRELDSDVRLVHSLPRGGKGASLERHGALLAKEGIAVLNLHETEWTLGVVTLVHRFGLLAFGWDVQEGRRIRALLGMGIDAVYSDHVERMVATVGEWTA